MWLLLAFLSAALLGFYDAFKKQALKDNAVLPVLFLNTVFSSLIFLPFILVSCFAPAVFGRYDCLDVFLLVGIGVCINLSSSNLSSFFPRGYSDISE